MPLSYTPPPSLVQTKANLNNDAFYRLVMRGLFVGQEIVNVFYYRVGLGLLPGGLNFGGAEALAWAWRNQIWNGDLEDVMPNTYKLEDITVYPYNGNFDPMSNLPYTLSVNEFGTATGPSMPVANCVIAKYNLEPQIIVLNGWLPPKRGWMCFGPLREGDVDESGRLSNTAHQFYVDNVTPIAADIVNAVSLVTFWPVRIRTTKVNDVITLLGFTDISGVTIRTMTKVRASRRPAE